MSDIVGALRVRFEESRRSNTPLAAWRELQLEILAAARALADAPANKASLRYALWTYLGESFWMERDVEQLVPLVDRALAALEAAAGIRVDNEQQDA